MFHNASRTDEFKFLAEMHTVMLCLGGKFNSKLNQQILHENVREAFRDLYQMMQQQNDNKS